VKEGYPGRTKEKADKDGKRADLGLIDRRCGEGGSGYPKCFTRSGTG
jgi:hypothetical protein